MKVTVAHCFTGCVLRADCGHHLMLCRLVIQAIGPSWVLPLYNLSPGAPAPEGAPAGWANGSSASKQAGFWPPLAVSTPQPELRNEMGEMHSLRHGSKRGNARRIGGQGGLPGPTGPNLRTVRCLRVPGVHQTQRAIITYICDDIVSLPSLRDQAGPQNSHDHHSRSKPLTRLPCISVVIENQRTVEPTKEGVVRQHLRRAGGQRDR